MYETFCRQHLNQLKMENRRRAKNEQWLQVEHNRSFGAWLHDQVLKQSNYIFISSNCLIVKTTDYSLQ